MPKEQRLWSIFLWCNGRLDSDPKYIYCRDFTFYVASFDYNFNLPDNYTIPNKKFLHCLCCYSRD